MKQFNCCIIKSVKTESLDTRNNYLLHRCLLGNQLLFAHIPVFHGIFENLLIIANKPIKSMFSAVQNFFNFFFCFYGNLVDKMEISELSYSEEKFRPNVYEWNKKSKNGNF